MEEKIKVVTRKLYDKYIFGTDPKEIVESDLVVVGAIPHKAVKTAKLLTGDVCLSPRALKHIHEARSDEHFEIILNHLCYMIYDPEAIYLNIKPKKQTKKRGTHLLLRELAETRYFYCVIEIKNNNNNHFEVVTVAPCKPEKYLKDYKRLWNREDA